MELSGVKIILSRFNFNEYNHTSNTIFYKRDKGKIELIVTYNKFKFNVNLIEIIDIDTGDVNTKFDVSCFTEYWLENYLKGYISNIEIENKKRIEEFYDTLVWYNGKL